MNRSSIIIIILLSIVSILQAFASDVNQCMLHMDKSFYAVGENVQFSLYLPNAFSGQDIAVKTVLLDKEGLIKATFFNKTGGAMSVSGSYKIPYQYTPGVYYLQFMAANSATNTEILLAEAAVPVYNYLEGIVPENAEEYTPTDSYTSTESSSGIEAKFPENVAARDMVNTSINLDGSAGYEVSVSVVNTDVAGNQLIGMDNVIPGNVIDAMSVKDLVAEIYATGKLTDLEGIPIKTNILGAYSSLENRFLFTRSNEKGYFFLTMPDFSGAKPVQILGYGEEQESINVNSVKKYTIQNPKSLLYNSYIKEYLELARMRKKIEQHFGVSVQAESTTESTLNPSQLESDANYDIREYNNFENMAEFFKEVLTPLRFREKKEAYEAFMFNPKERSSARKYFKGKPLFIINGKLTRNGDYVAKLPMDKINQVELFFNPTSLRKQFNAFGRFGVVRIVTNDPDLSVPPDDYDDIINVYGQSKTDQAAQDYSGLSKAIPVLSPQVYWMSSTSVDANTPVSVSYTQPDDAGNYVMTIVARDANGQSFTKLVSYKVD